MKSRTFRAALCSLTLLLFALLPFAAEAVVSVGWGRIQSPASPTTISAVNTNGASLAPSTNSFVFVDVPSAGSQVVSICIPSGSWTGALQGSMTMGSSTRVTIPNWHIVNSGVGFPTGIPSGSTGLWSINVQGPGRFYLIASAWSSGSITPTVRVGAGTIPPASWAPYFANAVTGLKLVYSGPCQVGGLSLINTDGMPVFLVCFDAASTSAVTLGSTVPGFVVPYPQSNGTSANGTADRLGLPAGVTFQNGLVIVAVTSPTGSALSTNGLTGSILWH